MEETLDKFKDKLLQPNSGSAIYNKGVKGANKKAVSILRLLLKQIPSLNRKEAEIINIRFSRNCEQEDYGRELIGYIYG